MKKGFKVYLKNSLRDLLRQIEQDIILIQLLNNKTQIMKIKNLFNMKYIS